MSYYHPRGGGHDRRGLPLSRGPREYARPDSYHPPQGSDNYRPPSSPPHLIDGRYGPPRRRDRSRSPGEYRDGRTFYDRPDPPAYNSRDHGRAWNHPPANYAMDVRMQDDGRGRWNQYDTLREPGLHPLEEWSPRDRERNIIYPRPREYPPYDDRLGDRPRGYGGSYDRPPPPPPNVRRESPPRRNPPPDYGDSGGWASRRHRSSSISERGRRSPARGSPRRRSRSRSRTPMTSPSKSPRTSTAGNHTRMRPTGAMASFPPKNEDELRRSSFASAESKPKASERMDVDAPQPGRSQAHPPSPPPPRAPASPTQPTKFKVPPTGPAAQLQSAAAASQRREESRTWIPGPRATQAQQQQPQKEISLKKEKEKEREKESNKPFDPADIPAKSRVRSEVEIKIEECEERLRGFDEKVLANQSVLAKARFDLYCAQKDHEYASFRVQVAQRQRMHLEKGLPMEAYDELEREGAFGPVASKV